MAKGGRTETTANMPAFQEKAIQQGIGQASDIAAYIDTPMPTYGPEVASFTPLENAAFQGTDMMAGAFGMPSTGGQSYMPQAQMYDGGIQGYSSRPMVEQMSEQFKYENPQLAEYRSTFGIDPVTGEVGSRALSNQAYALEMTPRGGGKQENEMGAGVDPTKTQVAPQGPANVPALQNTGTANNPYTQASMAQNAALGATATGLGYRPEAVNAIRAAGGMSAYQNPYEQAVVDKTLRDVGGAAQMGLNTLDAQASQAGAFGGSRHGVAMAEAAKGYQQQALDKVGALRQQGFNTALGASQFDVGNQMAAQQQNVANRLAGYQFRQGAANQLANLGQQSFNYGQQIQDRQLQQGAIQRGAMQQLIDRGQANFQNQYGAPQGLQTFLSAVYGAPNMVGQSQSFSPGLFNYMQLGAQMMPKGPF